MAKIVHIDENELRFSDGTTIHCDHEQDCCEYNYADFNALDDLARNYDFNTSKLTFHAVDGVGFSFGDHPQRMFFVPCYSEQNGYYSDMIDVYLNGEHKAQLQCEEHID